MKKIDKVLICSDIHGNLDKLRLLINKIENFNPDLLIILGDFYYSGPRNIPPTNYSPKECLTLINQLSNKYKSIFIQGNCDARVDLMVTNLKLKNYVKTKLLNRSTFIYHGDLDFNLDKYQFIISGHTHISVLELKDNNKLYLNPGSIGIPRDGNFSYATISKSTICIVDLESDRVIKQLDLSK